MCYTRHPCLHSYQQVHLINTDKLGLIQITSSFIGCVAETGWTVSSFPSKQVQAGVHGKAYHKTDYLIK